MLTDESAIKQLEVHIVIGFERGIPLPLALKPESIVISSVPAFDISSVVTVASVTARARTIFENVDQREQAMFAVVHGTWPVLL
jgi:hypothetical protein